MNCRRVVNLISAYIDGELTGEEMLEIRRHLSHCDECREEYESIRHTKMALANLKTTEPQRDLAKVIMIQLDDTLVPKHQKVINGIVGFMQSKLSPVAAALAISGAALVILTAGGTDNTAQFTSNNSVTTTEMTGTMIISDLQNYPVEFTSTSKPLQLADTNDFGEAKLQYASLNTH